MLKRIYTISILFITNLLCTKAQQIPQYKINYFDNSSQGYYFVCPVKIGNGGPLRLPTHLILDAKGDITYVKNFPANKPTSDFKLHANGMISYSSQGNRFYFMDSTFKIVDSVGCKNGAITDTHDLLLLPNGHFLLLGIRNVTTDLSSYKMFLNNGSAGSATATLQCGIVQELDAQKNVVFEWNSKDYFAFRDVDSTRLTNTSLVDWTHCNAIDLDKDGNILLSSRHFNEITKINRTTGAVMWRLGGKANQFTFTNDSGMFLAQHDIRRIGNGHITLFDNGNAGNPVHPATAKEYALDEINLKATLTWQYIKNKNQFSLATGNVQRLKNDNTLVNYGFIQKQATVFDIVDSIGNKHTSMAFNDSLSTYRAFNYRDFPWTIKRPIISCKMVNNVYYLDAGAGYTNYLWSNGATTQSIKLDSIGHYTVLVPAGNGGFLGSEGFQVSDINNPCGILTLTTPLANQKLDIWPNPIHNSIHVNDYFVHSNFEVYNNLGQKIWAGNDLQAQDFSYLAPGLYALNLLGQNGSKTAFKFVKN